jgi:hypothetical protein
VKFLEPCFLLHGAKIRRPCSSTASLVVFIKVMN